jgi:pimeloyl-ACP methyl ester carboxylesterase
MANTQPFEHMIEGPQGRLNLSEQSEGGRAPVLFVHSDGGNLHHWDQIRARLADRPTAAFDRRGHGTSDPPKSESFAVADAASDIIAAADALGWDRYFLVGHSGGALTAFAYASQEPDRLLGLVLVDPPPDPKILPPGMLDEQLQKLNSPAYAKTLEEYYRGIAGDNRQVSDRVLRDIKAAPEESVIGTLKAMSRFNPRDFLNYEGPALSIIQPQYDVDGALHRIGRFEHVAIDGAGHWIHLAAPDRFLDVLEEFLADNEPVAQNRAGEQQQPSTGAAD